MEPINGVPFKEPTNNATGGTTLAEDFDNFLALLTTQLENQDPLSPLDTTEFTNQLTQFAQVEQSINTNGKLDQLLALQSPTQLTNGVSYIGKVVEAPGDVLLLEDGRAKMTYALAESAVRTNITILDERNNLVDVISGNTAAGPHIFNWDGTDANGDPLPDGAYRVLVTPLDAQNKTIESATSTFGKVTGIESDKGKLSLILGPISVDLNDVVSVHEPEPPAAPDDTADPPDEETEN